jgi:hypothetical protein
MGLLVDAVVIALLLPVALPVARWTSRRTSTGEHGRRGVAVAAAFVPVVALGLLLMSADRFHPGTVATSAPQVRTPPPRATHPPTSTHQVRRHAVVITTAAAEHPATSDLPADPAAQVTQTGTPGPQPSSTPSSHPTQHPTEEPGHPHTPQPSPSDSPSGPLGGLGSLIGSLIGGPKGP